MADLFIQFQWVELAKQLTDWSLLIRKGPWIQLFFQTLLQLMPVSMRRRWTPQGRVEPWVNGTFAKEHRMSARQIEAVEGLWFTRPSVRDAIQNVMTLSRRVASAAPSIIEKRYPYLDQNLGEFLNSIPPDKVISPGQRGHLHRGPPQDPLAPPELNRKRKTRLG